MITIQGTCFKSPIRECSLSCSLYCNHVCRPNSVICHVATGKLRSAVHSALLLRILQLFLSILNSTKVGLEHVQPHEYVNDQADAGLCCHHRYPIPGSRGRRLQPKPCHSTKALSDCLEHFEIGEYFPNLRLPRI